ncbi:MAG: hypothetical protein ACLQVI_29495, partial [Polyangiaceae bacterium]
MAIGFARRYWSGVTEPDYLIAGLRVRLDDSDGATREQFAARLPEFQIERDGEAEVVLAAEAQDTEVSPNLANQGVLTAREPGLVRIRRIDFEGAWDSARRRATCLYMGPFPALNSFLRIICSYALLERGGVLLHASSVVSNGRAFAFVGPSGAGKTTMARLAAPRAVLSDEVTAVRPRGSRPATEPAFDCFPTPFWGD